MQLLLASPYLLWMLLNPLLLFTCVAAWAPAQQTFATEVQPQAVAPPPLEVRPLFLSGPTGNRVDFVFLADGYLSSEKDKFFADALFLAEDISANQTYNTVRPLLNFWAAFTPSRESGVGKGGRTKDTVFGLYRDGTELRGVWCNNTDIARAACESLGDGCDYPITVGNDPLYGGSGGYPTVITASPANGPQILRHELGHSIIDVGDEYDGGASWGYFGVNAAQNASRSPPWSHWLTDPSNATRVEHSVMPLQQYTWTMLNTSSSWTTTFISSGTFSKYALFFSVSGIPNTADLTIKVDGQTLPWEVRSNIGVDRWLYDLNFNRGLSGGRHTLEYRLNNKTLEGTAQLCSVEINEFGSEAEFISKPGHYGLYPVYSDKNTTTYRPTNEDCLMRKVTTPNFCSVCKEDLWLHLLQRVDLIDNFAASCRTGSRFLTATVVPFGRFRQPEDRKAGEEYTFQWFKNGVRQMQFDGMVEVNTGSGSAGVGRWAFRAALKTDEVRRDPEGLLTNERQIKVTAIC